MAFPRYGTPPWGGSEYQWTVAVRARWRQRGYRDEGRGVDADRHAVRTGAKLLLGLGATRGRAGFDTLSSLDRPNYDMWDPLASFAATAAVTQRIRLATTTLPLPNRNKVLVAKQAAVIDRLSDGRLTLGVSLGSRPDDYQVFGATLEHRVTRIPPPGRHPPTGMGGGTAQ